jgi:hypothetical protein
VASRDILRTGFRSLSTWMKDHGAASNAELAQGTSPQPMDVEESTPAGEAAAPAAAAAEGGASGARAETQRLILSSILDDYLLNTRTEVGPGRRPWHAGCMALPGAAGNGARAAAPSVSLLRAACMYPLHYTRTHPAPLQIRCAASVWAVSLLLYTGRHPAVKAALPQIQDSLLQVRPCPGALARYAARLVGVSAASFSGVQAAGRSRPPCLGRPCQGVGSPTPQYYSPLPMSACRSCWATPTT